MIIDQNYIDGGVIVCALLYNLLIIAVFILRAREQYSLEEKIGPVFDLLLIPFLILFLINLFQTTDSGRIGTILPMVGYLVYDIWYRQMTKQKPRHHPEKMPKELLLYILLFYFAGMAITGYAFIVSRESGYLILVIFMVSILAYFYYQVTYNKKRNLAKLT